MEHYDTAAPLLWTGNGSHIYYISYAFDSFIGPERVWPDIKYDVLKFFLNYWSLSVWIAAFYAMTVHLAQRVMVNRKAFELKLPLIVWNSALALFSLAGAIRMGEEFMHVLRTRPLVDSVSHAVDPSGPAAFWGTCFCLSKVLEMGDTVFLVLRKKPVPFLHWYHHSAVIVYVWHGASEYAAGGRWFMVMNYSMHALMYAYFAISAAGFRLPRAIAMLITISEIAQMFVGVGISFTVLRCKLQGRIVQQSYEDLALCFATYASFVVLFINLFKKSYLTKKEQKEKVQ